MALEDALVTYLNSVSALTAIIGTGNIYPHPAKQNAPYPNVTYYTVSAQLEQGLRGSHGVRHPRITITAWSHNFSDVKNIVEILIDNLVGYGGTVAGVTIQGVTLEDIRDMTYDKDEKVYQREIDVVIWYLDPGSQTIQGA